MNNELRIKNKKLKETIRSHGRFTHAPLFLKSGAGFTFIELLVVIVILAATGVVVGAILFSSLRGASKTTALSVVRQNGNFAISQMAKSIRNAKRFNGLSPDPDPQNYFTNCTGEVSSNKYDYIKITDTNDKTIVYACEGNPRTISSIDSNNIHTPLIDTNAVSLSPGACFSCSQTNFGDNPTVGINFDLTQKQQDLVLSENQAAVHFSTSVSTRNLSR